MEETGFKKTESLKSENIINGSLLITNYYKNDDEKVISIILYTKNKYEKHNNEIELNITKIEYGAVATDF